jgi:serine/threonine protein kinase/Tol biopolymer transport system component
VTDAFARLAAALSDRYRIERELGEGGMATVYLAEDLKHHRKVAIKVLKPELAAVLGAERFVQEIETTAALQHQNILPLFDSGSAGGFLYYVMPFVEGESLRDRLDREAQLGVEESVALVREVADALQYAHEHGVVHRDIKPENILLHAGRPMVADFGIALAVSAAAGGRLTETGLSLGTPHYMSPEQATAEKVITARSDLYSLASVLYEMLTGDPPHTGKAAQQIIAKIIADEARPVRELRKSVPSHVAAAIAKALEKLPADRFETARAFADALHNPAFSWSQEAPGSAVPVLHRSGAVALLAAFGILASTLAVWGWLRPSRARFVERYPTTLGTGARDGITFRVQVALSPDGAYVVFRDPPTGPGQLYIKKRDELTAQPLAGTEGATGPFFSPDGAWIGFFAQGQLRKIPTSGGAPLTVVDSVNPLYSTGAWLEDGSIFYYDLPVLRRISRAGGSSEAIASPATLGGRLPWLPTPLPRSRGILFTAHLSECIGPVSCRPSRVYVYDARRDTVRALFEDAVGAWYVPTGHVLYLTSSGTLMAVPWDNDALVAAGPPVPILSGVQAPGLVVSAEGTILYVVGPPEFTPGPTPNAVPVWVDRSGRVTPVDSSWQVNTGGEDEAHVAEERGWGLALSPDGRRIALTELTDLGTDIWIKQLPAGPPSRLTLDRGRELAPHWSPDGRAITFISDRPVATDATSTALAPGLWRLPADGTGEAQLLWSKDAPTDGFFSPDGQWLVLATVGSAGASSAGDILAVRPGVDSVARRLVATTYDEEGPAVSPNSRWLAYVSDEQGEDEVFVRPFPNAEMGKWQVSSGGGSAPVWSHSGRELFYVSHGSMYVVPIGPGSTFVAGRPRVLFAIPNRVRAGSLAGGMFAVAPDDQRFLMVRDIEWGDAAATTLVRVEGFFEELRSKMKP